MVAAVDVRVPFPRHHSGDHAGGHVGVYVGGHSGGHTAQITDRSIPNLDRVPGP